MPIKINFVGSSLTECMLVRVGTFSFIKKMILNSGKREKRELATFDEKPTSSGSAEPYARQQIKARTGGEKRRHL